MVSFSTRRIRSWLCWLFLSWTTATTFVQSSPSTPNYNAYHYDMTTPQFTPDGRLLQVEYAGLSSQHSSVVLVVTVPTNPSNNNSNDDDGGNCMIVMTKKSSQRGQDRLVILPTQSQPHLSSVHNHHIVLALCGVLSDSIALLQEMQDELQTRQRWYGMTTTTTSGPTTRTTAHLVATILANACQSRAFGGGLRPYGATVMVCGIESVMERSQCVAYQTDPSGAMQQAMPSSSSSRIGLVGGPPLEQREIRNTLEPELDAWFASDTEGGPLRIHRTMQLMARSLLSLKSGSRFGQLRQEEDEAKSEPDDQWLEAVVLSPGRGVHRLTDAQVRSLMASSKVDP